MIEKIKYYYKKGIYKIQHLDVFLAKGIITQAEYDNITEEISNDMV